MAPEETTKSQSGTMRPQAELDTISNRIQIALAKREELVKFWTDKSAREDKTRKTEEELDAEDALLFRNEPPYLGVGCPVPENFLMNEADRSKKTLRAKFGKGLQASKRRDAEEKAESAKRGLNHESSEEEEGRTALGRKKKLKSTEDKTDEKVEPQMKLEAIPDVQDVKEDVSAPRSREYILYTRS